MTGNHFTKLIKNANFRRKWREDRSAAEKTLNKRRDRYASDPNYRDRIKESVRKSRESKQPSGQRRSFNKDKIVVIDGIGVTLFSAGKTATILGVAARTIVGWETRNVIPVNCAKDAIGRRWYPDVFVEFLVELVAHRQDHRCDEWSKRVKGAWQARQLSNHPIPIVGEHLEDHHDR